MIWSVRKLLVPTDLSDFSFDVIEYASELANKVHADITLLHISSDAEQGKKLLESQKQQVLQQLIIGRSVKLNILARKGSVPDVICEEAAKMDADIIIMGTYGQPGIRKLNKYFQGSFTYRVVEKAPCAVISFKSVVKPVQFNDILLPLDLTKRTDQKVEKAINFAKTFGSTIHLLAVLDFIEEMISGTGRLKVLMDELAVRIRKHGIRCTTEQMRHDHVSNSVLAYADEINVNLIIIMTRQEKNINDWLMGSRARKIISHAERPVLSLAPE